VDKIRQIPIIHIYDREGKQRQLKLIDSFVPYFFVPKSEEERAKQIKEIIKIEDTDVVGIDGDKLIKCFTKLPSDVATVREKFVKTYESDIIFTLRFLIDQYKEEGDKQWRVLTLDIETEDHIFPEFTNPINKIISIACWDSYEEKYLCFIWREDMQEHKQLVQMEGLGNILVFWTNDEKKMLQKFFEFYRKMDYDIISGWNVISFDLLYIISRMRKLKMDKIVNSLSPLGDVFVEKSHYGVDIRVRGKTLLDLKKIYPSLVLTKRKSYSLDFISNIELGKGKYGVSLNAERQYQTTILNKITNQWRNNPEELIKYNAWDVFLCVELNKKLGLIEFMNDRRKVVGCRWDDLNGSVMMAKTRLLRWGKKNKIAILRRKAEGVAVKIKGAVVFPPKEGIYKNVMSFDFKSLYPSIIQVFNISPEVLDDKGEIVLADNMKFRKDKKGIIPQLFEELFGLRKQYKDERDKFQKGTQEYNNLDNKQFVTKSLINSIYGVLGNPYFSLFNPICANAITFMGRTLIKKLKEIAEELGVTVIYGDTDSCFLLSEKFTLEDYLKLTAELNLRIQKFIKDKYGVDGSFIVLEAKSLYKKILFTKAKKRYGGDIVWSEGKYLKDVYREIVGFETKRSDTSDFTEKIQNNIFDMILSEEKEIEEIKKDIIQYVKGEIEKIKSGVYRYEEIALPKGIAKQFNKYKSNTPWVRGTLYSNKFLGTNFQPGDRVKLLWIKSVKAKYPQTDVLAFFDGYFVPLEFVVDHNRMIESNILQKLRNLFEGLGWSRINEFDILGEQKNLKLFV